jgi:hypothetical protein
MPTNIKATKKFKALIAAGLTEDAALKAYRTAESEDAVFGRFCRNPRVQQLLDAGFTVTQAKLALAAPVEATVLSSKERGEALVAKQGLTFTKGRVYGGPVLAEAIVRVHKTGKPEIVKSSGAGRTAGVLVYKEESGDVAQQNLTVPA